ncbi:MAG: twin-arginine translocase TatA/TatE family subunit [Bacteroidia bacterium]|nr:twin-arginine translocase TatA/TatE family subunit [Bacteroidia bacterium]MDW8157953.1 twin-arginine translocase TatA/TatE family subunit [Bacteroidia bacterium]
MHTEFFNLGFIGGLGTQEILLILVVLLIFFGARKIPEFARGLGQGIREFRNAANNIKNDIEQDAQIQQSTLKKESTQENK